MMLKFFVGFLLSISFKILECRKCYGRNGLECCTGYSWNESAGICEKCPKGYFGNCSQRCRSPAYGEDCQSLCDCADGYYCHFANGCTLINDNHTEYQTSKKHVTSLHQNFTRDSAERVSRERGTSSNDLNEDGDIFKTNSVNLVIIVLIGIFVLCFALFVFTYIYLKCFKKVSNTRGIKEKEFPTHYKSLDFEAMIMEQTEHQDLEPRRRFVSDSTYLSPVFVHNSSPVEPFHGHEHEVSRENNQVSSEFELHRQAMTNVNEKNLPPGDLTEHVYIEITDDDHKLDTVNPTVEDCTENKVDMNITGRDNLLKESAYDNESR
uniref:Uncharacterized protein LOC111105554 isoform X2 n=1 Tax=Crassostrea virginica TaxID=6565 RepID=A0A8B8AZ65_CRAVI|nr:uncharacterized protein LOC111105554 isoform X2 [Crassostrea virginica]